MSTSTINALIYSNLPCPIGCSLSACLPENLNPIIVTTDEPASPILLNASAIIATDADRIPMISLPMNNRIFAIMPVVLDSIA